MKIGIDISQSAYEGTGVGEYVARLVENLVRLGSHNEYILFYSSLRKTFPVSIFKFSMNARNVVIKKYAFPPTFLDILWNRLHTAPIEWFIGDVDIFISSDWTQPPTRKAKSATILYDLIVYKHPEETAENIVQTQKNRMKWVKKECDVIFCISEATKKDAQEILGINERKLFVTYPGVTV